MYVYCKTYHHVLPITITTSLKPPTTITNNSIEKKNLNCVNKEEIKRRQEDEELNKGSIGILLKWLGVEEKVMVQEEKPSWGHMSPSLP